MENQDLVWDLDRLRKRKRAKELILGIENQLCVFSSAVGQLYTAYDIFFPKEENRKVVILPNPYSPHDTFHGIPEEAVRPTGLFLVANEGVDILSGLRLIIPINREQKKYRKVPLDIGLKLINSKRDPNKPFLPVVMKGDLRELDQNTPCMHLHALNLAKVGMLSELELSSVQRVILDRLEHLSARARSG